MSALVLMLALSGAPLVALDDLPDQVLAQAGGVGLRQRVVETCEGPVCYLRCSGNQTLTGSLVVTGTGYFGNNIFLSQTTAANRIISATTAATATSAIPAIMLQPSTALDATDLSWCVANAGGGCSVGVDYQGKLHAIIGDIVADNPSIDVVGFRNVFVQQGTSASQAVALTTVNVNTTTVGSGADTTEDNLMTYSLPASALSSNGKGVRVTAWGDGVSTADATTVRCYFGATVIGTKVLTASQANTWRSVSEVIRTGAATQVSNGVVDNGGTAASLTHTNASPGETLSGAVTIKCTGQRAVSSVANSVRQLGLIVEEFN